MRNWIFPFIILIFGLLQVTILDYFKVFGIKPDLLLISVVIVSLIFEFKWALALSIFAGIFKDVFVVNAFGINTLIFALWTFVIIRLAKEISIDNNFIRVALIFIIALLHNILTGLLLIYSGNFIPLGIFLRIVSIESLYTALVLPLAFKISEAAITYVVRHRTLADFRKLSGRTYPP